MNERFGKSYRLSSKKLIEQVFAQGERMKKFPLMMRYITTSEGLPAPFQVAVSVPKKNFKLAVSRNRIKRLIREVVRKNKYIIEQKIPQSGSKFVLFIIYSDRKMPNYDQLEKSIQSLFQKLPAQKDND